jgi:soluble lytic murein transglycosylase-like protein
MAPGDNAPFRSLVTLVSATELERSVAEEADLSPAALINRWQPFIHEASQRFSIPENWIRAVIRIESGGRTTLFGRPIMSGAGAMGVMQLMRDTYNEMREEHDLGPNPYEVRDNILAGTAYLRVLYQRYGYPFLFAAYNAGPGRLEDHLRRGHALPAETRAYVKGAVRVVAETCAQKKKEGIVLVALSKLSPIQPAMAVQGCIKAKR